MSRIGGPAPTTGRRPGPRGDGRRVDPMKYMIMMFSGLGATLADRSPEWIAGMQELLMKLDNDLRESGELVASHPLTDPTQATTVRFTNGAPVATDGPFPEIKEALAGFWIIEASR